MYVIPIPIYKKQVFQHQMFLEPCFASMESKHWWICSSIRMSRILCPFPHYRTLAWFSMVWIEFSPLLFMWSDIYIYMVTNTWVNIRSSSGRRKFHFIITVTNVQIQTVNRLDAPIILPTILQKRVLSQFFRIVVLFLKHRKYMLLIFEFGF